MITEIDSPRDTERTAHIPPQAKKRASEQAFSNSPQDKLEAGLAEPNEYRGGAFGRPLFAFLVIALPALWTGWLVYRYGVDTPLADEWDTTRLFIEKSENGTLRLSDFFAFHNEHRIFFPGLLTFALAHLTAWNVRAELLVIWILTCLCSLNLWLTARQTGWRNAPARHWLLLGANVLLFSPLQWENFLWGFQIGFLLPLAAMIACLWIPLSLRRPFDFLGSAFLCLVSTFSIASGFASWFLAAPLLLLWNGKGRSRHEAFWRVGWSALALASICFYFRGYARPTAHPDPLEALQHPFLAMQFLLAYLGNPFGAAIGFGAENLASMIGAALLLPLIGAGIYLWQHRRDRTLLARALPWFSLIGTALVNAFLTTLGRFGFGLRAGMQSRYVTFAVLLPIGLLFVVSLVFQHWRARAVLTPAKEITIRAGLVSCVTGLGLLLCAGTIRSIESWEVFQHNRLTGKATLLMVRVLDQPESVSRYVHWSTWTMREWAENLDRIGYLRPRLLRSARVREIAADSPAELVGEINQHGSTPEGGLSISGWAFLPAKHRLADSVLLSYDDAQGEPMIFARLDVRAPREDVGKRMRDKAYLHTGWRGSVAPDTPAGQSPWIRAWAFDADDGKAFIIGSVQTRAGAAGGMSAAW